MTTGGEWSFEWCGGDMEWRSPRVEVVELRREGGVVVLRLWDYEGLSIDLPPDIAREVAAGLRLLARRAEKSNKPEVP